MLNPPPQKKTSQSNAYITMLTLPHHTSFFFSPVVIICQTPLDTTLIHTLCIGLNYLSGTNRKFEKFKL